MSNNNENYKQNVMNEQTTTNGGTIYSGPLTYKYSWDAVERFIRRQLTKNCPDACIFASVKQGNAKCKPIWLSFSNMEINQQSNDDLYNGYDDVTEDNIRFKNQKVVYSWMYTDDELADIAKKGKYDYNMSQKDIEQLENNARPRYLSNKFVMVLIDPLKVLKSMWAGDNPGKSADNFKFEIVKEKAKSIKDTKFAKVNYDLKVSYSNNKNNNNDRGNVMRELREALSKEM